MSDLTEHNERDRALEGAMTRYEALVRDLGVLRELEESNSDHLDPEDVGARLVGAIAREDGAEHCSIMLLDPASGQLMLRAVGTRFAPQGYTVSDEVWHGKSFALGEGIAGHVAETRQHVCIDDTDKDPRFLKLSDSPVTVQSIMCFPLIADDQLLGVLNLSHSERGYFAPDRESSTWLLANRASALIHAAQRRNKREDSKPRPTDRRGKAAMPFQPERLNAIAGIANGAAQNIELRLTRLLDSLDTAMQLMPTEQAQTLLTSAQHEGTACASVVASLRRFAAIVQGPRRRSPVTLGPLLEDVCSVLAQYRSNFLTPCIEVAENLPPIHGDSQQLHEAMLGLGVNAVTALLPVSDTPKRGGSWLRMGAERVTRSHSDSGGPAGDYIRLFVADNGLGMTPALVDHACEPFYRGHGDGVGLGLTTAYHVARQHNGWLEIKSALRQGTMVSIYLPLTSAPARPKVTAPLNSSAPCVLLVDDEPLIRNLGKALLKRLGYDSLLAEDGASALELFEQNHAAIDIVILDVNMPGMNGPELLTRLRALQPDLPAIFSSGDAEDLKDVKSDAAPTSILKKPYMVATLEEVLRETLRT